MVRPLCPSGDASGMGPDLPAKRGKSWPRSQYRFHHGGYALRMNCLAARVATGSDTASFIERSRAPARLWRLLQRPFVRFRLKGSANAGRGAGTPLPHLLVMRNPTGIGGVFGRSAAAPLGLSPRPSPPEGAHAGGLSFLKQTPCAQRRRTPAAAITMVVRYFTCRRVATSCSQVRGSAKQGARSALPSASIAGASASEPCGIPLFDCNACARFDLIL